MKILRFIGNILSNALIIVLFIGVISILFIKITGGSTYVVQTGSMEPTLQPGDLVITKTIQPEEYIIGDIALTQPYSDKDTFVTHRIVDKTDNSWITKGDNNNTTDEPLVAEQLRGKVIYDIPKIGYAIDFIQQNLVSSIIGITVLIIIMNIPNSKIKKEDNKDNE